MVQVNTSVSHGTNRTQDLMLALLRELESINEMHARHWTQTMPAQAWEDDSHWFWDSPQSIELLAELFDALDEYAPKGFYFGAHPGDGSDYGWWAVEPEENDLEIAGQVLRGML